MGKLQYATTGCVQTAKPNPTGAVPINKIITDKPIINVPGCPPIGEVMAGVIVHYVAFGKLPELDAGKTKTFYSKHYMIAATEDLILMQVFS